MDIKTILHQFRKLNRDLLKDSHNYLFVGEDKRNSYIVTNLTMDDIKFPVNFLYKDGFIIANGEYYKVISREQYLKL